ncbi:hypothetical protein BpHYR1_028682 [Brachionus plicatilis]|uniref:Uncharacterized protein n=1 Tax=Brachionus plicatilis TaxID=10195 RepID=A0A3M7T9R1_BRAPC|nr:hypothetical protein BpHYR1_028682 [Brachionus plicatilis]
MYHLNLASSIPCNFLKNAHDCDCQILKLVHLLLQNLVNLIINRLAHKCYGRTLEYNFYEKKIYEYISMKYFLPKFIL